MKIVTHTFSFFFFFWQGNNHKKSIENYFIIIIIIIFSYYFLFNSRQPDKALPRGEGYWPKICQWIA